MKLTIISPGFNDQDYLEYNWELFNELNGDEVEYEWIVVNNKNRKALDTNKFTVLSGVPIRKITRKSTVTAASFQHGDSINKGLQYIIDNDIKQDYILTLDPDFFIIEKQSVIFKHLTDNNLDFFGVDYSSNDPRVRSVRNFPIVYCMYINPHTIPIKELDYVPNLKMATTAGVDSTIFLDTGHVVSETYYGSECNYHALKDIPTAEVKEMFRELKTTRFYDKIPPEFFYWNDHPFALHLHGRHNKVDYKGFIRKYK